MFLCYYNWENCLNKLFKQGVQKFRYCILQDTNNCYFLPVVEQFAWLADDRLHHKLLEFCPTGKWGYIRTTAMNLYSTCNLRSNQWSIIGVGEFSYFECFHSHCLKFNILILFSLHCHYMMLTIVILQGVRSWTPILPLESFIDILTGCKVRTTSHFPAILKYMYASCHVHKF